MHPEIIKIKATKKKMINDFSGFQTKPKNLRSAIMTLIEKYEQLSTYDVVYALSPHYYKQEIGIALTALEFDRILKHDYIKDIVTIREKV